MTSLKRCIRCGETKSLDHFTKKAAAKDGRYNYCKECDRLRGIAYRAANIEKVRAYNISYRHKDNSFRHRMSPKGKTTRRYQETGPEALFRRARHTARWRGVYLTTPIPFTITAEDVKILAAPMTCAITGMKLRRGGVRDPLAPSLDRIDNKLGYVKGNIQVVARWVNLGRNATPLEEFKDALRQFDPSKMPS